MTVLTMNPARQPLRRWTCGRLPALTAGLFCLIALTGCGQMGPLTLPAESGNDARGANTTSADNENERDDSGR